MSGKLIFLFPGSTPGSTAEAIFLHTLFLVCWHHAIFRKASFSKKVCGGSSRSYHGHEPTLLATRGLLLCPGTKGEQKSTCMEPVLTKSVNWSSLSNLISFMTSLKAPFSLNPNVLWSGSALSETLYWKSKQVWLNQNFHEFRLSTIGITSS